MQCPLCGAMIQDDAIFCTNCGQKLPEQPAAPVVNDQDETFLSSVRSFIEERRGELQTAISDNQKLVAAKGEVDQQLSNIQAQNMDLSSKIADLEKQIKDKDQEMSALKEALEKAQQAVVAAVAAAPAAAATAAEAAPAEAPEPEHVTDEAPVASAVEVPAPNAEPADAAPADNGGIELPENEADLIDEPTQNIPAAVEETDSEPAAETTVAPAEPAPKICPSCGSPMPAVNKFCTNCGTALPQ